MIRLMRLTDGILYIEQGESYRVVTAAPMDKDIRKAYRRMTQKHNTFLDKPEWLPDGEYYYAHGQMYQRHTIAG